jgi:ABC-type transporter MlaC component
VSTTRLLLGFLLSACLTGMVPPDAKAEFDAVATVRRINQIAIDLARREAPSAPAAIRDSFDMSGIARTILGTYWPYANPTERQEVVDLVLHAIVDAMARRLGAAPANGLVVIGNRRLANGDALIATRLTQASGRVLNLDWRMHQCAHGPCVIDLIADGASVAIQQRDEFAARMTSSGHSIAEVIASMHTTPRR